MESANETLIRLYNGNDVSSWIVIIPGLGDQQWNFRTSADGGWLKALARDFKKSEIFFFKQSLQLSHSLSWIELINSGTELLVSLMRAHKDNKIHPIIFIGLGLGGLVVKQALWKAHQQDIYQGLERLISGLVFIGTPHSRRYDEPRWKPLIASMKRSATNPIPAELEALANVSKNFEEINSRLPILTAYETNETKIREKHRFKTRLIVGREWALMNTQSEILFGIEADYYKLCHFDDRTPAYLQLSVFIGNALKATESRLSYDRSSYDPTIVSGSLRVASHAFDLLSATNFSRSPFKTSLLADASVIADYSASRKGPRLPCYQFKSHARNGRFFGREECLNHLKDALLPALSYSRNQELKTFALCGLGGVGKTEIAVEFMYTNFEAYDAVFWLQADKPSKLAEDFAQIAISLGLEDPKDAFDQEVSRGLVKSWLAKPAKSLNPADEDAMADAKWLLIFDNVDHPDILRDFWPKSGSGSVLVTSRDPIIMNWDLAELGGRNLQPFEPESAADFLLKLTYKDHEVDDDLRGEASSIAEKLGGLPLAITQIAGIINSKAVSLGEFLESFHEDMKHELRKEQWNAHSRGYEHSLASVWAFDRLDIGSSALFDIISLLDSGPIREDILKEGATLVTLQGYPKTPSEYQDARGKLIHSSLITRNQKSKVLLVHRLTQYVARDKMNAARVQHVFEAAVTLVSAIWIEEELHKKYDTTRWREHEAVIPHVQQLRSFYKENESAFIPNIQFAKLLNNVAWYFHERGKSHDHMLFTELAQSICQSQMKQTLDVDLLLIEIYYNRGSEASQTNQPQLCLDMFQNLLDLCQRVCLYSRDGEPDEHLASAYNEVGVAYMMNQRDAEGIEAFRKSIAIYEGLKNYTKNMSSFPMVNLGISYWLRGWLSESSEVLLRALSDREELYGPDDTVSIKTGRILYALGNLRRSQNMLSESFEYHRRSLEQYRATIGHSHHRTADACHKVAEHYIYQKRFESARKLLEQALRVYRGRSLLDREKARSSFKMGRLLQMLGNADEADPFLEDAIVLFRKLKPQDNTLLANLEEADFDELVSFWSQ